MPSDVISPASLASLIASTLEAMEADHGIPNTKGARALLLAIALQESGLKTRVQYGGGPAHGLFQFEAGGGVKGVLAHPASRSIALVCCADARVTPIVHLVWEALARPEHDILAIQFARLLLRDDPHALPEAVPEDEEKAWQAYVAAWRPGKPHREAWGAHWAKALEETA